MKRIINLAHYRKEIFVLFTLVLVPFNLHAANSVSLGVTLNGENGVETMVVDDHLFTVPRAVNSD